MSRMPYLTTGEMTPQQQARAAELTALRGKPVTGPGAFWLRNPAISACAEPMRQQMEQRTSLAPAVSELAMTMAARHWSATYAWCRHAGFSIAAGIAPAALDAISAGRDPGFVEADLAATYTVTRELLTSGGLREATYNRALDIFGRDSLIDLVSEVGYGSLVALANTTFEPDAPRGETDYLPPGTPPPRPSGCPAPTSRLPTVTDAPHDGLIGAAAEAWALRPAILACARAYDDALSHHLSLTKATRDWIAATMTRFWRGQAPADAPLLGEETIVVDFVTEMLSTGRASDATFDRARDTLGLIRVTEIPAVVGFLCMTCLTANVFAPA